MAVAAPAEASAEKAQLSYGSGATKEWVDACPKGPAGEEEGLTAAAVVAVPLPASATTSMPAAIEKPLHFETPTSFVHRSSAPSPCDAEKTSGATSALAGVDVVAPKAVPPATALVQSSEEVDDLPPLISPKEYLLPDPSSPPTMSPPIPPPSLVSAPSVNPIFITGPPPELHDPPTAQPVVTNNKGISLHIVPVLHGNGSGTNNLTLSPNRQILSTCLQM